MAEKKTMTLNLTDEEMTALDRLSQQKGLSKTALLRQALRLYQSVHQRIEAGERMYFEDPKKSDVKSEVLVL